MYPSILPLLITTNQQTTRASDLEIKDTRTINSGN